MKPICVNSKSGRGGQQDAQPSVQDRIYDVNGKGTAVTQAFLPNIAVQVGNMPSESGELTRAQAMRIYDGNCKAVSLKAEGGGMGAKTGLYAMNEKPIYQVKDRKITIKGKEYPIQLEDGYYNIRKLTVEECMRLQTVPEWYEFPVSNSQAYKMLGNGWTCDVITHLINCCLKGELAHEQMTLF